MIILGIDPGFGTVGYGVVVTNSGGVLPFSHGAIVTSKSLPLQDRLREIYGDIISLVEKFKPAAAAVEQIFYTSNQKTVIEVAEARGVILLALKDRGVPTFEYTPLQVKTAVTGYGRATKRQMMEATRMRLKLESIPRPDDAADALAIALCHAGMTALSARAVK
jgi:crossover junction endodeoxyribonuclease RuvC